MSNSSDASRLAPLQRRAQIVEIAAAHFARDGAAGASVSAIAKEAGITRALVYHYFPGKESLLEAVLEREAGLVLSATAPDESLSQRANVERALRAFFEHFAASSGALRELYAPSTANTSTTARLAASNHQVQVQRLLSATGTDDAPESRLTMGAWLAFVEYTARRAADAPSTSVQQHLDVCVTALESVLGRSLLTT